MRVTNGHRRALSEESEKLVKAAKNAAIRGFLRVSQPSGNETVP